jgi:hypothetical protein
MYVDVHVARRRDGQVERPVLAQRVEHVVEERDPGSDLRGARAVEVDLDEDLRLLRDPLHATDPAHS